MSVFTISREDRTAAQQFEYLCGCLESKGYEDRLRDAALDALGGEWIERHFIVGDRMLLEHVGGRVRVFVTAEAVTVLELDRFGFERTETVFRGGDRLRPWGPRGLRFALALVEELSA